MTFNTYTHIHINCSTFTQCNGRGDLLERFGPYTRVALERDPEISGRDVEWHRDVLAALPEEGEGGGEGRVAYGVGDREAREEGRRCCVCGTGRIADPVVVQGGSGALACRECAARTTERSEEPATLGETVLCEADAEALARAAGNLRRELEGMADAGRASEGAEWAEGFLGWIAEALQTLGSAEAGIAALRENRCGTWEAAERTLAATVARIQHVQNMLS